MIKHFDHFVLNSIDPIACLRFYEKLGFRIEEHEGHYHLRAHTFGIRIHPMYAPAILHAKNPQTGTAFLTWEVELNSDELVNFLKDHDINIEKGPLPHTGFYGIGMSVYVRDPDGNLIELISYQDIDANN